MKIGDRAFVHGYVDEIRNDTVIIKNKGGYFGTDPSEVFVDSLQYNPPKLWTPVSERLPEEYGEYMVAWIPKDWSGNRREAFYEIVEYEDGEWIGGIPQAEPLGGYEVLAWMELPPAYMIGGEG